MLLTKKSFNFLFPKTENPFFLTIIHIDWNQPGIIYTRLIWEKKVFLGHPTSHTWSNFFLNFQKSFVTLKHFFHKKLHFKTFTDRYGHAMAVCERKGEVYIFSGTLGRTFEEDMYKFNLSDMSWSLVQFCPTHMLDTPTPRCVHLFFRVSKYLKFRSNIFIKNGKTWRQLPRDQQLSIA